GWLKESRRIGTRFEKLAVNFHGMLQLAMIRRYLRILFSDRA
ncbi:MAG: transposase, partial [Planctomycetes bacterium]|nr:transposase [Planctomycetota bacterium]